MFYTTPNFALYDPPCENQGRVGEISIPIVGVLPTTRLPKYIDGRPLRGCWARLVDKNINIIHG